MLTLTDIYVYPIKSLAGIRLTEARVEARGLAYDRRWLLVDEHNRFLTQRTFADMALLAVTIGQDGLTVRHRRQPDQPPLHIPFGPPATDPVAVRIWEDVCAALPVSAAADQWFTDVLGRPTRLVYMPESTHRPVNPDFAPPEARVSFADGYPFMLIGQASLDNLNARLTAAGSEAVPMNRFRPNFVVAGGTPHAEDTWQEFTIGAVPFRGLKPCARCNVTTINQDTAQAGKEPLRELSRYRAQGTKVIFGENVLGLGTGTVRVGDEVRPQ